MEIVSRDWIEKLKKFDVPTICNALEALSGDKLGDYMKPGLLPRTGNKFQELMVGYAATARVSAQTPGKGNKIDHLMDYYDHVKKMPDPTIAVIQDTDKNPIGSFWGEVQATVHRSLGAVGTITEGGVRDLKECEELGFSMYSRVLLTSHAYVHVEMSDCPVYVGELEVNPGELLVCDHHGIARIPSKYISSILEACQLIVEAELPVLIPCREAIETGYKPTIEELRMMRLKMEQKRSQVTSLLDGREHK